MLREAGGIVSHKAGVVSVGWNLWEAFWALKDVHHLEKSRLVSLLQVMGHVREKTWESKREVHLGLRTFKL